jgi:hypothetical protein
MGAGIARIGAQLAYRPHFNLRVIHQLFLQWPST